MVVKAIAFVLFIISGILVVGLLQERYLHLKTKEELAKTKTQLTECNAKIDVQNAHIESMKAEYEKKLKSFQATQKTIQKVFEPLRIEIPQEKDECTALKQMLEEYREAERSLP
jgi:hypothetical protein